MLDHATELLPVSRSGKAVLSCGHEFSPPNQKILSHTLSKRLLRVAAAAARWETQALANTPGLTWSSSRGAISSEYLAERYPGLGQLWATQRRNWAKFLRTLSQHASVFAAARGSDSEMMTIIGADCSDLHDAGRSVLHARFADGSHWFYKPRRGDCETRWFDLLHWLNHEGFSPSFHVLDIVCGVEHSWMQAVEPAECRSADEVAAFYYRAGALLYLLLKLGGVDFHAGNLIAAGSQPVLVDCETLLHPATKLPKPFRGEASVLRTGLLPNRERGGSESVSALGRFHPGPHRARFQQRPVYPGDYVEAIVSGFDGMSQFLRATKKRRRAFQARIRSLESCERRLILRPTSWYYHALERSLSPALLRSRSHRRTFLRSVCEDGFVSAERAEAEWRALEIGEIPMFRHTGPAAESLQPVRAASARRAIRAAFVH